MNQMDPDLHDAFSIGDSFATKLAGIQRLGSCTRFVFAVPDADGLRPNLAAVAKLVLPTEEVRAIAQAMLAAVADVPADSVAPALKNFDTRDVRAS